MYLQRNGKINGNPNGVYCKHIPALPEVLLIADSLDLNRPATKADFITNQTNDVYCINIASLIGKPSSVNLYDGNGSLLDCRSSTGPYRKWYMPHFVLRFFICGINPSYPVTPENDGYTFHYVKSSIGLIWKMMFIRPHQTSNRVAHKTLSTLIQRNYDCFLRTVSYNFCNIHIWSIA